jgi:hypothetical protein
MTDREAGEERAEASIDAIAISLEPAAATSADNVETAPEET